MSEPTRVCDAAVEVLRATDNPAVGWGDSGLLHQISERAGKGHEGPRTEERILNALDKTPGLLVKRYARYPHGRLVRVFWLPETVPSDKKEAT